jgi:hypothetical protein
MNSTFGAINQQFKPPYFRVVDFPALPHGRRVIDREGGGGTESNVSG